MSKEEKKTPKTYRITYWDELQDRDMWIEIEAPTEKIAMSRIEVGKF